MKQLTYALWLKSTTDFSTKSGLVNVITAAFNGISHSNRRFSFTDYPPEYSSDIQQLADLVNGCGFAIGEGSFISMIEFGFVRTYIANISLPAYGEGSFVRFIVYGDEPIAQQFDFSGSEVSTPDVTAPSFINLTITVNSPYPVFLTGSSPILRNWDPFNAIPLLFLGGRSGPAWNLTIPLLPGEMLEFKLVDANGQYEPGPNRVYTAGNVDDQLYIG
jgi:Starch binding domain